MKNRYYLLVIVILWSFVSSCDDFLERELSGQSVVVLAPLDNTVSSNYTQSFWWEELKGASKYKLQIVKSSFVSIQELIVDTVIVETQFSYTLQPGSYQWRLRGENSVSVSDYITYNLTIDSSLNLGNQTLLLNTPLDNLATNSLTQSFTWYAMPNATSYLFGVFNQSGVQIGNYQSTSLLTSNYTFPSEGVYKWRVIAQNNQSVSPYSERLITIDTTKPSVPIITFLPFNDTTSFDPVPLTWNSVEANANYHVFISSDSSFVSYFDTITSALSYDFYNSNIGQFYYWKVKTIDNAGNLSAFSVIKRFKRQ
ncbi:MAG: hypothetical protein J0L87_05975 [Bacteroidetes bacterium]|nr:hypothetical protein [Bacteroidota bacterium]